MATARLQKILFPAAILLIPILAFWQISLMQYTMKWDMMDQLFPWRLFMSECFHQHILPLWCPYAKLGYPFYADPQSGFFYPLAWVFTYFFKYTIYACSAEFIVHILLAFYGMYFLLVSQKFTKTTSFLFGLLYSLSGIFVGNSQHAPLIGSMVWMPYILSFYFKTFQKKKIIDAIKTGFFLYLLLTGGYLGIMIILAYCMVGLFLYFTYQIVLQENHTLLLRWFLANGLAVCCFLLLSAGYLYSAGNMLPYISRENGVSFLVAGSNAFTPQSLISLLFPMTTASGNSFFNTDISMSNLYLGIFTLPLLFIALLKSKSARILFCFSLFFLFASFGNYTPLRGWLFRFLPLLNLFQHASIFRYFVAILWIVIAAEGFEIIFTSIHTSALNIFRKTISVMAVIIAFIGLFVYFRYHPTFDFHFSNWSEFYVPQHLKLFLVLQSVVQFSLLIFASVLLFSKSISLYKKQTYFAVLLIFDMLLSVQGNVFSTVVSERNASNFQQEIDKLPKGFSIPNDKPINSFSQWGDTTLAPPMWQNAGYVRKQITPDGFNGFKLKNYEQLVQDSILSTQIFARPFLICTNEKDSLIHTNTHITAYNPNLIQIASNENISSKIKLMQMYFPGWALTIDGIETTLPTKSFTNLLGTTMDAGKHTVVFEFEPFLVKEFFAFTVLAVLFCCGFFVIDFWRTKNINRLGI